MWKALCGIKVVIPAGQVCPLYTVEAGVRIQPASHGSQVLESESESGWRGART